MKILCNKIKWFKNYSYKQHQYHVNVYLYTLCFIDKLHSISCYIVNNIMYFYIVPNSHFIVINQLMKLTRH